MLELEIHNIEKTDFTRVGGRYFDGSWSPEDNNEDLKRLWGVLADISHDTLTPDFERLYWFGGWTAPAYDIEGKLGNTPPSATIKSQDTDLELLLPVYRSMVHRGSTRPAVLGVWTHENQVEVAQVFMRNLDFFSMQLASGDVYTIMRRPDRSLLATRYDSPRDFRADYFNVIQGEQGKVLLVTNDPDYALKSYQREETEGQLDRISHEETDVPFMVRRLPRFLARGWVAKQVNQTFPSIEDTLK